MKVTHQDITGKEIPDIHKVKVPINLAAQIHEILNPGTRVVKEVTHGKPQS